MSCSPGWVSKLLRGQVAQCPEADGDGVGDVGVPDVAVDEDACPVVLVGEFHEVSFHVEVLYAFGCFFSKVILFFFENGGYFLRPFPTTPTPAPGSLRLC